MAAASTHYMYVLECADGSLYTGYAVDVRARLAVHNAGKGAKYTRARLPEPARLCRVRHQARCHARGIRLQAAFPQRKGRPARRRLPRNLRGGPEKRAYLTCPMGRPKRGSKSHRFHESGGKCQFDPEMVRGGSHFGYEVALSGHFGLQLAVRCAISGSKWHSPHDLRKHLN